MQLNLLSQQWRTRKAIANAMATMLLVSPFYFALFAPPATASDDAKEEKRIEALEEKFFSQTYKTDSDDARLARVEDMLFNHARRGSTAERLDQLEQALGSIKASTKVSAPATSATDSRNSFVDTSKTPTVGNNTKYRHFVDMDDRDDDDDAFENQAKNFYNQAASAAAAGMLGSQPNTLSNGSGAKPATLVTQQLGAMETQIFGKPNPKAPMLNRVKKLEQNILPGGTDTSSMSLPDRVKNLWTNLNSPAATTSSASKNKVSRQSQAATTATNDDSAPAVSSERKHSKAKAADDEVSDDQAMAEYLQKLRKNSSPSNSGELSASGKRTNRNTNKSGWVDDGDLSSSKNLDPDYSSGDDNPPIVVGGNSSMSSMQTQGYVQNFGSPNQGNGLISKLGAALGGAMNGNNNYPYGYGNMYGGYPNIMPYGYGGMSPYSGFGGLGGYGNPYGIYGGLNPYGGYSYSPPVMGPSLGGIGSYGNVSPYGSGGPRPGNPYGVNPYSVQPYGYGAVRR